MSSVTIYSAVMVDDGAPLSLHEMACFCEQHSDWVVTLVREGLVCVERNVVVTETSPRSGCSQAPPLRVPVRSHACSGILMSIWMLPR